MHLASEHKRSFKPMQFWHSDCGDNPPLTTDVPCAVCCNNTISKQLTLVLTRTWCRKPEIHGHFSHRLQNALPLRSATGVSSVLTTPQIQIANARSVFACTGSHSINVPRDQVAVCFQKQCRYYFGAMRFDFSPFKINGVKSHCTESHVNAVYIPV